MAELLVARPGPKGRKLGDPSRKKLKRSIFYEIKIINYLFMFCIEMIFNLFLLLIISQTHEEQPVLQDMRQASKCAQGEANEKGCELS